MNNFKHFLAVLLVLQASIATAHTVWLEPANKEHSYDVLFGGHAGKLESYQPEKLKLVEAFDVDGKGLALERSDGSERSQLHLHPETAIVAIYFDNGIWSKDRMGKSINKPMQEVPGAKEATRAVKYHKTILQWSPQVKAVLDQEFEVLPLNDVQPVAGKPMQVKILLNGKPLADVKLGHGEIGDYGITNSQGIAEFVPKPGFNKLWAGKRFQVTEKDHTELSYEYLLGFYAVERE